MARYQRIKGGEKNEKTGVAWTKLELEEVCDLYIELGGKNIHENNPKIHQLATKLSRTIRSVENQLLAFKKIDTGDTGRQNYNSLVPIIWLEKKVLAKKKQEEKIKIKEEKKQEGDSGFRFKISSQLKNIIGKDLILDDYVGIFELVKNSYDAHAKNVKILFSEDKIIIKDDGKGMDKDDLINKWLFVAYSAKKEGTEDLGLTDEIYTDYRNKIRSESAFAGTKGIGRFSADRLGSKLKLTTRKVLADSNFERLNFDWDEFEMDAGEDFENIYIEHQTLIDSEYDDFDNGLILEISDLRTVWNHEKIRNLKWSLEKLINPFESIDKKDNEEAFSIEIIAPKFIEEDANIDNDRFKANGFVHNFIFETLNIKTTQIRSWVGSIGDTITTELIDRGELIYKIKESNDFQYLPGVKIHLYYLNTTAKNNFTRQMGINATKFGSVFLFNKGFRVFPFGEPDNDPFQIDKRKNQGRTRFLGSREILGRIEIWGNNEQFQETTSREGGLIDSPGTSELERYFMDVLKKLERYVVDIQWPIKDQGEDLSKLSTIDEKAKIIDLVKKLTDRENVELVNFSLDFFNIIAEKSLRTTPEVFDELKALFIKKGDTDSADRIDKSKSEYIKLQKERDEEERKRIEAEARATEEERKRIEAEERAAEEERKRIELELKALQTQKQVKFYQLTQSLDIKEVQDLHHQIIIDAGSIDNGIVAFKMKLDRIANDNVPKSLINSFIQDVAFANKKVLSVARFTTKENFMAAMRSTKEDLIAFIKNYLSNIYKFHDDTPIDYHIINSNSIEFVTYFRPIEMTIVIDNLVSNSRRKGANNIYFSFSLGNSTELVLIYKDDGEGLDKTIVNPQSILDRGVTTTRGSGIGLSQVFEIMRDEFDGTIEVNSNVNKGIEFILKFKKNENKI